MGDTASNEATIAAAEDAKVVDQEELPSQPDPTEATPDGEEEAAKVVEPELQEASGLSSGDGKEVKIKDQELPVGSDPVTASENGEAKVTDQELPDVSGPNTASEDDKEAKVADEELVGSDPTAACGDGGGEKVMSRENPVDPDPVNSTSEDGEETKVEDHGNPAIPVPTNTTARAGEETKVSSREEPAVPEPTNASAGNGEGTKDTGKRSRAPRSRTAAKRERVKGVKSTPVPLPGTATATTSGKEANPRVKGAKSEGARGPRPQSTPKPRNNSRRIFRVFRFKRTFAEMLEGVEKLNLAEPTLAAAFETMGLKDDVVKGIHACGYTEPAECQQRVIVPLIQGRDVICQAQSGMGKTAAFCIAILQRIDVSVKKCQALILVPTRELAFQICDVLEEMGKQMGVITVPCIGQDGKFKENMDKLKEGVHVAVGTCGRICHLLHEREKPLFQGGIKTFVIDEADKMVMGGSYSRDLQYIIYQLSTSTQFVVMSATMPTQALEKIQAIMKNPYLHLAKDNQHVTLEGIRQFHVSVGTEERKIETLVDLFPLLNSCSSVIFCNTRSRAIQLCKDMKAKGHALVGMVGSMDQQERNTTMRDFKAGKIRSLVASDLLGRGLDFQHLKLVINYDFPEKPEEYIHRVGRAGRYGRKGIAITLILDSENEKLEKLQDFYTTRIQAMPIDIANLMEAPQ